MFLTACARHGIQTLGVEPDESEEDTVYPCSLCGHFFNSKAAQQGYMQGKHRARDPLRDRVVGSTCQFRLVNFHSRVRLRTHLTRGNASCVTAARSLRLLTQEEIQAEDAKETEEAQEAKLLGQVRDGRSLLLDGPADRYGGSLAAGACLNSSE